MIALIENVGFGGTHAAPTVKAVYETYVAKRNGSSLPALPDPTAAAKPGSKPRVFVGAVD